MDINKKLYTTKEAAAYLGVGKSTLDQSRLNGNLGIPFVRLGSRAVRYRIKDLENYVANLESLSNTSQGDERNE